MGAGIYADVEWALTYALIRNSHYKERGCEHTRLPGVSGMGG